jgi:3',5'-cyclic AMP phosphodiesterase CpdA
VLSEALGWAIICLDTNPEAGGDVITDPQYVWLEDLLTGTELDDYKLISMGHHPIWEEGSYAPDNPNITKMMRLLSQNGVDLYLTGHTHRYFRHQKLKIPTGSDTAVPATDGMVEIVNGAGGHKLGTGGVGKTLFYNASNHGINFITLLANGFYMEWHTIASTAPYASTGIKDKLGTPANPIASNRA